MKKLMRFKSNGLEAFEFPASSGGAPLGLSMARWSEGFVVNDTAAYRAQAERLEALW